MNNLKPLMLIQKRLPVGFTLVDETNIAFNDDEIVAILSWIKYFNIHFKEYGIAKSFPLQVAIISKRLRLDFGLYKIPSESLNDFGKKYIYISENGKNLNGSFDSNLTIKKIVHTWKL